MPISSAATGSSHTAPLAAIAIAPAPTSTPHCSSRAGPRAATKGVPNNKNRIAPSVLSEARLPTRSGAMPSSAVITGATTGIVWLTKTPTVCTISVAASGSMKGAEISLRIRAARLSAGT
jgi:hypothetical protein